MLATQGFNPWSERHLNSLEPTKATNDPSAEGGVEGDEDEVYEPTQTAGFVHEVNIIQRILDSSTLTNSSPSIATSAVQQICVILEKYHEQCQLLDPYIQHIVGNLVATIQPSIHKNTVLKDSHEFVVFQRVSTVVYTLSKVRGSRIVSQAMSHTVHDLEPVLNVLIQLEARHTAAGAASSAAHDDDAEDEWQTEYTLLLWLSIIVLIPFSLTTVDSSTQQPAHSTGATTAPFAADESTAADKPPAAIVPRLLWIGQRYLFTSGPCRDVAAILLARLLSRPDLQQNELNTYLQWCTAQIKSTMLISNTTSNQISFLSGILHSLFELFKTAQRDVLLPHTNTVFHDVIAAYPWVENSSTSLRKLIMKLGQRVGTAYLPPQVASWRYQRGTRSLFNAAADNSNTTASSAAATADNSAPSDIPEADVPEEIEELIQLLLDGLRDKDTVVRWSAAKGIGRVTNVLPLHFADQVVESVAELLSDREDDSSWHGGCLALAELARRGLLVPARLQTVVPLTMKALQYDIRVGTHSIGSHVRDAACYVIWAFARAYAPHDMKSYVSQIGRALLIVAVYDREINVRRAACAAYQENVGRQGSESWANGIAINTSADYFTVTQRPHAFIDVAIDISQYEDLAVAFLDHLTDVKLKHWQKEIRLLAATALNKLINARIHSNNLLDYTLNTLLPRLRASTFSDDLPERHGSCIGCAAVIEALFTSNVSLSPTLQHSLLTLIPELDRQNKLGNAGGAIMREAVSTLIQAISTAQLNVDDKMLIYYANLLDENIGHPNELVVATAVQAFKAFSNQYYVDPASQQPSQRGEQAVQRLIQAFTRQVNAQTSRGVSLALGHVPPPLLLHPTQTLHTVSTMLLDNTYTLYQDDAEVRRNSLRSLEALASSVRDQSLQPLQLDLAVRRKPSDKKLEADTKQYAYRSQMRCGGTRLIDYTIDAMLIACDDYSTDNRGDVGSWVREQALISLAHTVPLLSQTPDSISPQQMVAITNAFLKQFIEKLDKLREVAGSGLHILTHTPTVAALLPTESLAVLQSITEPEPPATVIDLSSPSIVFPQLMQLLDYTDYRYSLLSGLMISIGGLTENVVRCSSDALIAYLTSDKVQSNTSALQAIASGLIRVLDTYRGHARVLIPTFKAIDIMLSNNCFTTLKHTSFPAELYQRTLKEITKSTQIQKIAASINVFIGLLPLTTPGNTSSMLTLPLHSLIRTIGLLLTHRFPTVRRTTSEQLYTYLLVAEASTFDLQSDDELDVVRDVLLTTSWDTDDEDAKTQRDVILQTFGISVGQKPAAGSASTSAQQSSAKKDTTDESKENNANNNYASYISDLSR